MRVTTWGSDESDQDDGGGDSGSGRAPVAVADGAAPASQLRPRWLVAASAVLPIPDRALLEFRVPPSTATRTMPLTPTICSLGSSGVAPRRAGGVTGRFHVEHVTADAATLHDFRPPRHPTRRLSSARSRHQPSCSVRPNPTPMPIRPGPLPAGTRSSDGGAGRFGVARSWRSSVGRCVASRR